ncbi:MULTISPECIES: VOC family protein [unclassified Pseudomonas]|jgi:catechol 2,3-dioxygenase-like lactoylglutathione lyase family enzyme|uniref:VOC family protein n=1 Tax=unclassified Pseudomonas TaxID=196821 RepID=UPI00131FA1B0|nr:MULTISPECIES: VOC family protein [unclassified Pseudomonas]MDX9667721.1 VOC family protein [Pseudomonas sp. P5_152]QHD00420.1 glyoxalase [Pseudomonas sp. S04]QHF32903.1 glyoxalase [Pseudomonas sp. S19]
MKFGYLIIYVPDVRASLEFFSSAFGLATRFIHESGTYGELETGETALAFAADELAGMNFSAGHVSAHASAKPLGMEVALVTDDVLAAHARALQAGAREIAVPVHKPWGQTVSYVRCPDGTLVELCSPIA